MLPKLQNKTHTQRKKTHRTFYKNTENNKYSYTHTKNKFIYLFIIYFAYYYLIVLNQAVIVTI